ncbi:(deoxy)nucleoside triphosphate pyrophosphohydrolase [Novosphingobium percolationis]|uniref:(deoxy)nucleoside triphosphate pyrophosphohydrolase n=1 Tax=Novosphingobium percolationis TaxID=2871811 RepID=UPI001CD5CA46|nr:(deoxy)nucleoside triphosphate pyrophosphohydrolase [Novosphingobium percolationis]
MNLPLLVVAAALIDERARVLVQRRPDAKEHGGLWEFPGGKVERGETPDAALARELAEELGIDVAPQHLEPVTFAASGAAAQRAVVLLLYACRDWTGTPLVPACDAGEGAAIAWHDAQSLSSLALAPGTMPPLDVPLANAVVTMLKSLG